MQRLLPVRPSRTTRKDASNSYFSRNGKEYTGNIGYYENAATFYESKGNAVAAAGWKAQADSVKEWSDSNGVVPGSEFYTTAGTVLMAHGSVSFGKLFSTELQSRFAVAAMGLLGLGGMLTRESARVPADGRFSSYYLAAVSYTIAAGTSEVQRNIIAQRGLGMPRA